MRWLGVNVVRTLRLLAPVLLWCQRFRAANCGLHAPDSGTGERANHPGVFGLNLVGGLKSMRQCCRKSTLVVVIGVTENEQQLHAAGRKNFTASLNQRSSDA